jgi:hypothetical protein
MQVKCQKLLSFIHSVFGPLANLSCVPGEAPGNKLLFWVDELPLRFDLSGSISVPGLYLCYI